MGYRATRPLDDDAKQAANAAVRPQTGGRPLTMAPEDAELRREWMEAYMDALGGREAALKSGKVVRTGPSGKPVRGCTTPCAKGKKVRARVATVTFRSDHLEDSGSRKLLKKSRAVRVESKWKDYPSGARHRVKISSKLSDGFDEYMKPEWDIARGGRSDSHPVSHTMDEHIRVDVEVEFEITPEGETATLSKILGRSAKRTMEFEHDHSASVSSGRVTIPGLQSKRKLARMVQLIEEEVEWSVVVDGEEIKIGETGKHTIYVTLDRPFGKMRMPTNNMFEETGSDQIVTDTRLRYSVRAAKSKGRAGEKECVAAIVKHLKRLGVGYFLGHRYELVRNETGITDVATGSQPTLHHYLWMCNLREAFGECHNIAAAFALACRIIGVKGSFEVGYMFPWPSRKDNHPDYDREIHKSASGRNVLGRVGFGANPFAEGRDPAVHFRYLRDHLGELGHGFEWLGFVDGTGRMNNFEGVVVYEGKGLYAIGENIFDHFEDPHDNASSFYASGNATTGAFNFDESWGKLSFACGRPYGGKTRARFKWED